MDHGIIMDRTTIINFAKCVITVLLSDLESLDFIAVTLFGKIVYLLYVQFLFSLLFCFTFLSEGLLRYSDSTRSPSIRPDKEVIPKTGTFFVH